MSTCVFSPFLGAFLPVCSSVRPPARPSVRLSARSSVRPPYRRSVCLPFYFFAFLFFLSFLLLSFPIFSPLFFPLPFHLFFFLSCLFLGFSIFFFLFPSLPSPFFFSPLFSLHHAYFPMTDDHGDGSRSTLSGSRAYPLFPVIHQGLTKNVFYQRERSSLEGQSSRGENSLSES